MCLEGIENGSAALSEAKGEEDTQANSNEGTYCRVGRDGAGGFLKGLAVGLLETVKL